MFIESLNPQQVEAVCHTGGPLIVVAGAGSGKTRVITCRIIHLIREKQVSPENILAITFTNKAAGEMKARVHAMLDHGGPSPWISTFHSLCLRILRRHIGSLGHSSDFVIYDAQDQLSLVKETMKSAAVSEDAFPPRAILQHISGFKNDFLLPKDIDMDSLSYGKKYKAAEVYPVYQAALKKNNALDFDDLLILTVRLFEENPAVLDHYRERFRHILVDEFQDTNLTQYRLIRLLAGKYKNVCVVGDDDQSIYRWRGANLENILHFERDFPGIRVIKLEQNYRSTQNILKAAGEVVKENIQRKSKTLWTENEQGERIVYYRAADEVDEAESVCDRILHLNREEGLSFNDMAVLYRTNAQSRVLEDALRQMNIPYQVVGGLRFYERREVKDVLAYFRVILNPSDSVSLRRIINVPARGIGKTSLEKVAAFCAGAKLPLMEGLRQVEEKRVTGTAAARKISQFVRMMDELASVCHTRPPTELLEEVLDRTGYLAMLEREDTPESRGRLENLRELASAIRQFVEKEGGSLKEFLDTTALVADIDSLEDERGILPLMTLHSCKGLEFGAVFIIGMENGLLPHASSYSDTEEYEEERRLCYVGFTRAGKKLFLSNARRRMIFGNTSMNPPSDFLQAIPGELLVSEVSDKVDRMSGPLTDSPYPSMPEPSVALVDRAGEYSVGTKVLHAKFGTGVVINREGAEDDLKVEIFFKRPYGKKKLAVKHARLIVL